MSRLLVRTMLARRPPTRDTGQAAAGRAGFNSGKNAENVNILSAPFSTLVVALADSVVAASEELK